MRNTGTSASSGTTTINFNANVNGNGTGYLLPGTGQGWTCDNDVHVRTCTNDAAVPAGGSLPPLTFPFAAIAGSGGALAIASLTNPSDGTINNNTLGIDTPVVQNPAVNLSMSVSDGGSPFVAQKDAATSSTPSGTWTVTVRNTGTSASSGTTTINFNANVNGNGTGYLLPGTGQGWTCDNDVHVRTCTNDAAVPAGGSLPPLTFPFAAIAGSGAGPGDRVLDQPQRRNHQQQHPRYRHPRRTACELD